MAAIVIDATSFESLSFEQVHAVIVSEYECTSTWAKTANTADKLSTVKCKGKFSAFKEQKEQSNCSKALEDNNKKCWTCPCGGKKAKKSYEDKGHLHLADVVTFDETPVASTSAAPASETWQIYLKECNVPASKAPLKGVVANAKLHKIIYCPFNHLSA